MLDGLLTRAATGGMLGYLFGNRGNTGYEKRHLGGGRYRHNRSSGWGSGGGGGCGSSNGGWWGSSGGGRGSGAVEEVLVIPDTLLVN